MVLSTGEKGVLEKIAEEGGRVQRSITSLPSCRVQNVVWTLVRRGRQLTLSPALFGCFNYQTAPEGRQCGAAGKRLILILVDPRTKKGLTALPVSP